MSQPPPHILLLTGPAGVGKSTLGWEISAQLRRLGCAHVVLDSDELDRAWPLSRSEQVALNRSNLQAFWFNVSRLGHSRLLLIGVFLDADDAREWITAAIPSASLTRVALQASDDELERRIRAREIGSEGDEQVIRSLKQARRFRRLIAGNPHVLDTDRLSVPDLARQVIGRSGWTRDSTR